MLRGYDIFTATRLALDFLTTKILYKNARLIRKPFSIKGKSYVHFGKNFTSGRYCRIDAMQRSKSKENLIIIGDNCQINDLVHIAAIESISIGNNVLIASRVFITDHNHGKYSGDEQSHPNTPPEQRKLESNPIRIEDNVWIGEGVCILPGVNIGSGSIIGSNSVVTKNIPRNSIAIGIPAKIIKNFNEKTKQWETNRYSA